MKITKLVLIIKKLINGLCSPKGTWFGKRCSGWRVYPGGDECGGCSDCDPRGIFADKGTSEDKGEILVNMIRTPDGTLLQSRHTHDQQTYFDSVSNEYYMVDGGRSYLRRNINKVKYKELSLYETSPFHLIRNRFTWGTFGEDDNPVELHYIKLKDMSDQHILRVLDSQTLMPASIKKILKKELHYRHDHLPEDERIKLMNTKV